MLRCIVPVAVRLAPGLFAVLAIPASHAATPSLDQQFNQTVRPFITKYCVACHSGQNAAAQFDLKAFTSVDAVLRDHAHWALVSDRLTAKEMPPAQMPQPPAEARQQVIDWIKQMRTSEASRTAGDPGQVLARRLSNAEYNYTIRDLTGVDLRPTREFPIDPANPAGFDNSGESLTMSSGLLAKYLQAAREVGDHLVLTPDSFDFSPHPMLVAMDREKYAVHRIVEFYLSQPTDYANYFEAAWRYKHRAVLGKPNATLESTAADARISAKYLAILWPLLEESPDAARNEVGPIAKLQSMWRGLPVPNENQLDSRSLPVHELCLEMRDFVKKIRLHTSMQFTAPIVRGLPGASQPLLNWKLKQYTEHRREFDPKSLLNDNEAAPAPTRILPYPGLHAEASFRWASLIANWRAGDQDLVVPAADRSRYEESFARFATVFPDVFFVSERGRYFPDDSDDKGRLLSAGYHSVLGFYRDDRPLMELILDENGQKQLNRLWDEFEFIGDYTARTFIQFFFNQAGEVDGKGSESEQVRPEGMEVTDAREIAILRDKYIAKAKALETNSKDAVEAITYHFNWINDELRGVEKARKDAEPKHLEALLRFASHAYRRPLSKAESDDILAYYNTLREKNALSHEDAIRDSVVSVLMSPDFLYRIDLNDGAKPAATVTAKAAPGGSVSPISAYALANRLSYFLWSSTPDQELLGVASSGQLLKTDVLIAQTRRMMKDPRARGLATEFAGNWLGFRSFQTINSVDRERFPTFTNDLREAMFQEPIRFMEDVIRNDRSVLDLIYGDYTFVNPSLAKHYGMPGVSGGEDHWVRVDNAKQFGRGGILPMAVFLTQNSPGLRTSPVKRGYWVVHRVMGEIIPPPPPVVPELPNDEAKSDLPIREMLEKHRSVPACAGCHAKFDTFGLVFENYGPVGDSRSKDLAGRAVDTKGTFPGGIEGTGFDSIEKYIREHRQNQYLDNLSRKLLVFALNRSLVLSDEQIVDRIQSGLAANNFRFGTMVETIVTSPQFLNKRSFEPRAERSGATKER